MTTINQAQLDVADLVFTNEHDPSAEAFEIRLSRNNASLSWASPFHLHVNGELAATFQTFSGLSRRADTLIAVHDLQQVEA